MRHVKIAVYEEWAHELVPAVGHGPDIWYRIFWGTVNWAQEPEGMRRALVVFMQYGQTRNWQLALAHGEIVLNMPAHVVESDLKAFDVSMGVMRDLIMKQVRQSPFADPRAESPKVPVPKVVSNADCPYCRGEYNRTHYQVPVKAGEERKFLHDQIGAKDLDGPGSVICSNQDRWDAINSVEHFQLRGDVLERQGGLEGPTVIGRWPKGVGAALRQTPHEVLRYFGKSDKSHNYVARFESRDKRDQTRRGEEYHAFQMVEGLLNETDLIILGLDQERLDLFRAGAYGRVTFFREDGEVIEHP